MGQSALNRAGKVRTGLLHHGDVGPAFPDLNGVAVRFDGAASRENCYRAGSFCLWYGNAFLVPADSGGCLDGGHNDPDHVPRDAIVASTDGTTLLLNPAQRHCGGRVAGDDGKSTTLREQTLESRAGKIEHLNGWPHPVGCVP